MKSMLCDMTLTTLLVLLMTQVPGQAQQIKTDRDIQKALPVTSNEEMFQFVIFGDRTGGPVEGMKILADAVNETNLLDPDLVLTVGDLVNGYNQTQQWLEQMKEYRDVMDKLQMPWFPVAGNHDIFWRQDPANPEPRPANEHEENFEKHFGPLWYWFEHKQCGFLVLYSDEGHPDGRPRDYTDPQQQKISDKQLAWMTNALDEMQQLRHVFVFLHHPYWWDQRYPDNNWDRVHEVLARPGNVRAVFAGHIHFMRYDGARDGIEYYALAVTGGGIDESMTYQHFGVLHHYNVVTVRPESYSVASIPVGGVFDPKQFTHDRVQETQVARYLMPEYLSSPLSVARDGSVSGVCIASIKNPLSLPIEVTLLPMADATWAIAPDHRHGVIQPGEQQRFAFAVSRDASPTLDDFSPPELQLRLDVLAPDLRMVMPARQRPMEVALAPEKGSDRAAANRYLMFDGETAAAEISLKLPNALGPFTVEAWVKPAVGSQGGIVSNLAIGGWSLDVAKAPRFRVQTDDSSVDYQTATRTKAPIAVAAPSELVPNRWSHLAGVFDGKRIHLFVDGALVASAHAPDARVASDRTILVGALGDTRWNLFNEAFPVNRWHGALDDVRVSTGARYRTDFDPVRPLANDEATLLLMSNDEQLGPFIPIVARGASHAYGQGRLQLRSDESLER